MKRDKTLKRRSKNPDKVKSKRQRMAEAEQLILEEDMRENANDSDDDRYEFADASAEEVEDKIIAVHKRKNRPLKATEVDRIGRNHVSTMSVSVLSHVMQEKELMKMSVHQSKHIDRIVAAGKVNVASILETNAYQTNRLYQESGVVVQEDYEIADTGERRSEIQMFLKDANDMQGRMTHTAADPHKSGHGTSEFANAQSKHRFDKHNTTKYDGQNERDLVASFGTIPDQIGKGATHSSESLSDQQHAQQDKVHELRAFLDQSVTVRDADK